MSILVRVPHLHTYAAPSSCAFDWAACSRVRADEIRVEPASIDTELAQTLLLLHDLPSQRVKSESQCDPEQISSQSSRRPIKVARRIQAPQDPVFEYNVDEAMEELEDEREVPWRPPRDFPHRQDRALHRNVCVRTAKHEDRDFVYRERSARSAKKRPRLSAGDRSPKDSSSTDADALDACSTASYPALNLPVDELADRMRLLRDSIRALPEGCVVQSFVHEAFARLADSPSPETTEDPCQQLLMRLVFSIRHPAEADSHSRSSSPDSEASLSPLCAPTVSPVPAQLVPAAVVPEGSGSPGAVPSASSSPFLRPIAVAPSAGRKRVFFSEDQKSKLNFYYGDRGGIKHSPSEIAAIARDVGISEHQVRIYFQNKRARTRDKERASGAAPPPPTRRAGRPRADSQHDSSDDSEGSPSSEDAPGSRGRERGSSVDSTADSPAATPELPPPRCE